MSRPFVSWSSVDVEVASDVRDEGSREREQKTQHVDEVFQQHGEHAGVARFSQVANGALALATRVERADGHEQCVPFDGHRGSENAVAQPGASQLRFGSDFAEAHDTLVYRKSAAECEQHDPHDQRPEIQLAAVAERMRCVGFPPRAPHAVQQDARVR